MSLSSDVTVNNFKDFWQKILPYLNVGNGGTSDTPLGQVAFFDDVVAPAGWLIADGSTYNIADYPDLANQYERVHGSKNFYGGNGTTTFAVPDLQGEFLRASGTNSHTGQGSGGTVGEHQDATEIPTVILNKTGNDLVAISQWTGSNERIKNADAYSSTTRKARDFANSSETGGTYAEGYTSRPTNTSLLCCVKAVPSSEMNTYSTTERRVGTWIDGKPIYQKTFEFSGLLNTAGWHSSPHNIANMGTVISVKAVAENPTTGYFLPVPYCDYSSVNGQICMQVNRTDIRFGNGIAYAAYSKQYATIRYTKTTD